MTTTVQPLKKVRLQIAKAGGDPAVMECIFGVASDGLCPFESELIGMKQGDTVTITVSSANGQSYFGHLWMNMQLALGLEIMPSIMNFDVEIAAVKDPENREVVQSLANTLSHGGCGGSCGCGCG